MAARRTDVGPRQTLLGEVAKTSPALRAERKAVFAMLRPVVDIIGIVVGNHVEIVLHDLTKPEHSILKIVNGHVSGRSPGDSILSGPNHDKGFVELQRSLSAQGEHIPHLLISDYQAFTRDGRALRSSTVIFRDSQGVPFASLCINADMSTVIQAHALLQSMLHKPDEPEPTREVAPPGIDVLMREIIAESVRKFGKPVRAMDKQEKVHAVEAMLQRGLFTVKGGVEHAATALGVTRFTIYNYLDAIRHRNDDMHLPLKPPVRKTRPD